MQTVPMIDQPAVINEAAAPRATRSSSAKSDDRFSPVLNEARRDRSDDELAGAAMVAQNQDTQQQVVGKKTGIGQENETQDSAKGFVATDEAIAAMAIMEETVVGETVLATVLPADAAATAAAAGELKVKTIGTESAHVEETAQPQAQIVAEASQRNQNPIFNRNQSVAESSDLVNKVEVQEVAVSQMAASTGEAQPLQQLNVLPLQKIAERGVGSEKGLAKGTAGSGTIVTDPLFASLLNKPEVGESLRQQQGQDISLVTMATSSNVATGVETTSATLNLNGAESDLSITSFGDSIGQSESLGLNVPTSQNGDGVISSATHPQMATLEAGVTRGAEVVIPLRDGSNVPEGRVVQQTIDHLTLHARGESSNVTVKLHPEELGELQLRMVMEGDQLKVHLQAQSQQVQEVLERNFPRLRDALQDQGITVDDFQVSVDSGERGDQQSSGQHEFVSDMQADHFSTIDHGDEAETSPPVVESRIDGRSVSLRV